MSHDLFVYGTLMRSEERAALLSRKRRRPARTQGRLYGLPAGYPALTHGDETVFGELVEGVSDAELALIDLYEGVGQGLYERRKIAVSVDTEHIWAWAYWMADPVSKRGWHLKTGRFQSVRRR